MAPEAPADTAGPSSPPPQLPEGWLPQWEGVRRQWYYVQRTTGKSQWDIPTEPIHLTPSTTPSIGGGPSQAPHQTNNSTRGVESGNNTTDDTYSVAGSARISSSLNSQIYPQSETSPQETEVPGWYQNQSGQHLPAGYGQQAANAGYGPNPPHGAGQMNGAQPQFYANQAHPGYVRQMAQNVAPSAWGHNPGGFQGQADARNMVHHPESFQGYPANAAAMHGPPASWTVTSNQQEQMNRAMAEGRASQPQWQSDGRSGHMAGDQIHPSTLSQPFYASYTSPQHAEQASREYASRSSNPSLHQEVQQYPPSMDKFPSHSPQSMIDQGRFKGYPVSHSQSPHAPIDPALQGFSPLQHAQSQYQQQHMVRTQSGSEVPRVWPGHQGGNQQHNQSAQMGPNPYLPQHQMGNGGPAGFPETAHVHQVPYHPSGHYPAQNMGEAGVHAGSQFVSGPWTSTPPSSGPL